VPTPPLLHELLTAFGPTGHEAEAASVWRGAASGFAEVSSDTLGSSFARVGPGGGAPAIALIGHVDEIGLVVTHADESGLLRFALLGAFAAESLLGARVELRGRGGPVRGVIGRARLSERQVRERPKLELADLVLDVGARSREEALALVRPGDAGAWVGAPVELPNGRLVSKALDNRLGAYVVLEAARRVAEAGDAHVDVVAVAAVQEEVGGLGARPASFALEPLAAIVVDVTYTTDVPGSDPGRAGQVLLDGGPVLGVGPSLNKRLTDRLFDLAEREGVAHGVEVYPRLTQTDADEVHLTRAGIPTALVSVPLRYMHTPSELCSLADVEACVTLLAAFARSIRRGDDFVR
jgi:endoglucanase